MEEYLTIADSPVMFLACAIVILYVLCQSFLFMYRAWRHGKELGMSKHVMRNTVTGSVLFSIVQCLSAYCMSLFLSSSGRKAWTGGCRSSARKSRSSTAF